jgi:UDP-N-acetylglucosamine 4-epimerase
MDIIKKIPSFDAVKLKKQLSKKNVWLITGVAGFIGSNILEFLLKKNQTVIGIDNLSSGRLKNIRELQKRYKNRKFIFKKKDITNKKSLREINKYPINYIIHLAALVSVEKSIKNPQLCNKINIKGFENVVNTIKNKNVKKLIFASSAAIYGNDSRVNFESNEYSPMSPYAISKAKNEIYSKKISKKLKIKFVALRYFNIFGKRQSPNGSYASVIPKWVDRFKKNKDIYIYGDGTTTRDFCHVDNVVLANILSAFSKTKKYEVFNVGSGFSISLNDLFKKLTKIFLKKKISPIYKEFKQGDIRISKSSIKKIQYKLGYKIIKNINQGLQELI